MKSQVIVLVLVIAFIGVMLTGCGNSPVTPPAITKAEWRQKCLPYYNIGGSRRIASIAEFKRVMGDPASTQTINGSAYWYYDCSDGVIQVELIDPSSAGNQLLIQTINDY